MSVGHYENFPVASRLIPRALRGAVVAIYRFARAADDVADEGDASPADRLAALSEFGDAVDAIGRGETPAMGPFPELARAIRSHRLALEPFHDLLSAFRQDVTIRRYHDYRDLADYCRRSANPIGRLLLTLFGADRPSNVAASDAVCTGLQLANICQDVASDWARGRVYLPQDELVSFGVDEKHIGGGIVDDRWSALMRFQTDRARGLIARGDTLVRALPLRLSLEIAGVVSGGLRVLERIDAVGGDVFGHRPVLGPCDWAVVATTALLRRASPVARAR